MGTGNALGRIAIIGGGISGLAALFWLQCNAPEIETVLLERDERLGGKILTERTDGFVIEAGPDSFLSSKPWALALSERLGLDDRLIATNPDARGSYVSWDGRLHRLPEGLSGLIPAKLGPVLRSPLLSPAGRLRLALDLLRPAMGGVEDETLAAFIERRLGREAYDRVVEPLMAGIYAGDGTKLSLQATFPHLRELERRHHSLLRGVRASRAGSPPTPRSAFLAPRGGMGEFVACLASRLAGRYRVGASVSSIERAASGYVVRLAGAERIHAGAAIVATPAHTAAELLESLDPAMASTLAAIPSVSTATISLAFRAGDVLRPLDGYGYIVPRAQDRPVLACTWTSTKFAGRAPEGFSLLRLFVGRAGREKALEGTDADLERLAKDELRRTLGITAEPALRRVFRWPRAMPQYTLGHLDRLAAIEERVASQPGLYLAGHSYRGVGIPDCIHSGEEAAARAAESVRVARPLK